MIRIQSTVYPDQATTFNDFNLSIRKALLPAKVKAKKGKVIEQIWSKNVLRKVV